MLPEKGFNCCSVKLQLRYAGSRFAEPRSFLQRERVVTFCIVQKVTKKHAGLRPATSIQIAGRYEIFAEMSGIHQVTGNAENNSFPGIAGNDLNRCDAPALQHKIRAKSKRTAVFFADSRLRVVRIGGGGWKRGVLDGNRKRLVRMENFLVCKSRGLSSTFRKVFYKNRMLLIEKVLFSNRARQLGEETLLIC